jgi:enoyl-CoA hydratase
MEPSEYTSIAVSVQGQIGVIEMIRPEEGNPLEPEGSEREMHDAMSRFQRDRQVRVVVLTGSGDVFSRGGHKTPIKVDPAEMGGFSLGERLAYGYSYGVFWEYLPEYRKPVIAAVNGLAADGAWELALLCDLIVASESAVFHMNHFDMGINPCQGTCHYLSTALGKHRAMDLVLNAKSMTARECLEVGLVNLVVPDGQCLSAAIEMAGGIAQRPPLAVALTKRLISRAAGVHENHDLERTVAYFLRTTEDSQAASRAWATDAPAPEYFGR